MADSGQVFTYRDLDEASNQAAQLFVSLGLAPGDHIAILLENHPRFLQICWAAQRAGLYYTPISWRLQQEEIEYIVNNCEAKVFITSHDRREVVAPLVNKAAALVARYMIGGTIDRFDAWEDAVAAMPVTPIDEELEGVSMLYSSGTTGYPKGIKKPMARVPFGTVDAMPIMAGLYGATPDSIYLSPAPLYHAAPLGFTMTCIRNGIQVVVMEHFDAENSLRCVQDYCITHSQWVPTMFVRMLKLPEEVRLRYDISSLNCAIHAAAPCPVPIKEQMIDWWGPVLYEYYAGTEGNGFVQLNSAEWLEHRGSVGRPLNCEMHICNEAGEEVPIGEPGTIYFGGGGEFEYYKDPDKTAGSRHPNGWTTLGDVGYLDDDGYLYLTDRKDFMIITGGVNVYPQETENILITHPKVMDVAVIGVPNEDFGEEVKAVVQPMDMADAGADLADELMTFCREHLSHIKCPRSVDFDEELPRHPTGKLYKRLLKDRYWSEHQARV
jgi:acyl-CoA synthetase (AMP-forming)/AMP-acid ligase II